jgi:hypothetical protein
MDGNSMNCRVNGKSGNHSIYKQWKLEQTQRMKEKIRGKHDELPNMTIWEAYAPLPDKGVSSLKYLFLTFFLFSPNYNNPIFLSRKDRRREKDIRIEIGWSIALHDIRWSHRFVWLLSMNTNKVTELISIQY